MITGLLVYTEPYLMYIKLIVIRCFYEREEFMTKTNIVIGAGLTGAVIANLLATLKNEKVL